MNKESRQWLSSWILQPACSDNHWSHSHGQWITIILSLFMHTASRWQICCSHVANCCHPATSHCHDTSPRSHPLDIKTKSFFKVVVLKYISHIFRQYITLFNVPIISAFIESANLKILKIHVSTPFRTHFLLKGPCHTFPSSLQMASLEQFINLMNWLLRKFIELVTHKRRLVVWCNCFLLLSRGAH